MKDRDTVPAKAGPRTDRDKRLAEALRANLRRRKSAANVQKPENGLDNVSKSPEKAPELDENED